MLIAVRSAMDVLKNSALANQMFCDRRTVFHESLGWGLNIDSTGRELDEYDFINPYYIIVTDVYGNHVASTRILPTTGRTMIVEKFSGLTDGIQIESATIWEVSRFFVSSRSKNRVRDAARLMYAGCETGIRAGITHYVGVTSTAMVPIFKACGWPGEVISTQMSPEGEICSCLWEVTPAMLDRLRWKAHLQKVDAYITPSSALLASPELNRIAA